MRREERLRRTDASLARIAAAEDRLRERRLKLEGELYLLLTKDEREKFGPFMPGHGSISVRDDPEARLNVFRDLKGWRWVERNAGYPNRPDMVKTREIPYSRLPFALKVLSIGTRLEIDSPPGRYALSRAGATFWPSQSA